MAVPARRAAFDAPIDDLHPYGMEEVRAFDALDAGEPIWPRPERGSSMPGALLVVAVLMAGGWMAISAPADWLAMLGARIEAASALLRDAGGGEARSDFSSIATASAASAPPTSELAAGAVTSPAENTLPTSAGEAPSDAAATPIETATVAAVEEAAEPQPLPPVHVDPADPYQRRAAAAGLHPGLSRVLLTRLSASDYRNARHAIDTAIAKTADDGVLVWPRQRKPEEALFRVHFVPGAAEACRRYVVTVVKDGWSTTALPMERCGTEMAGGRRAQPAVIAR